MTSYCRLATNMEGVYSRYLIGPRRTSGQFDHPTLYHFNELNGVSLRRSTYTAQSMLGNRGACLEEYLSVEFPDTFLPPRAGRRFYRILQSLEPTSSDSVDPVPSRHETQIDPWDDAAARRRQPLKVSHSLLKAFHSGSPLLDSPTIIETTLNMFRRLNIHSEDGFSKSQSH